MELTFTVINVPEEYAQAVAKNLSDYSVIRGGVSIDFTKPLVIDFNKIPFELFSKCVAHMQCLYFTQEVVNKPKK